MQTANMCPHHSSECAKADLIIIHFSWFNKVLNWHFMGHCWMSACDIRAGTRSTSCDPGSSPSSPLAQTTQRDKTRAKWDTFLFFKYIGVHPGQDRFMKDVEKCSQHLRIVSSSREITPTTVIWTAMCSLQVLFQICSFNPHTKGLAICFIAPWPHAYL